MIATDFEVHVHDFLDELDRTINHKNREYADDADVLANFRETSKFLECSMFEALLPHMHKHYRAIAKGFNSYTPDELRARLIDLCAYAIFTDIIKQEAQNDRDS